MSEKQYNVLVLCTGNSARSILGEVLFNSLGKGKFIAYSAGSKPVGRVNLFALELLQQQGHNIAGLRSKSWDEFAAPGAPGIDFIFTVCDNAAGEACPIWPGKPAIAHWGIPDPAGVEGGDEAKRAAFKTAYNQLARRIQLFTSLPIESMDKPTLKEKLAEIGRINLDSSVEGFVGANSFAHSTSYVRINSHPQNRHNHLNYQNVFGQRRKIE